MERYYSTQLKSLNVGVREVQSLEISLYHRVNKGSTEQNFFKKNTEGKSVKRKTTDLALNMLGWMDIFSM